MLKKQIIAQDKKSAPSDKIRVRKALSSLAGYDIINGSDHLNHSNEDGPSQVPVLQVGS